MIGRERQAEILARLAEAAKTANLFVAPIGSGYYFVQQSAGFETKDFDAVVHADDLAVADLDAIIEMAKMLGDYEVTNDRAVVVVRLPRPSGETETDIVELIRGRPRINDGFLPRPLLKEAGRQARRAGRVLWYPPEFVLMMKVDAAIDRQARADKGGPFEEENRRRAETFRADVFRQVQAKEAELDLKKLATALNLIKENRRAKAADLIAAASAGRLRLV